MCCSNSQVIHATSPSLEQRFSRVGVVQQRFAHEPVVVRGQGGEFVMFWTGCDPVYIYLLLVLLSVLLVLLSLTFATSQFANPDLVVAACAKRHRGLVQPGIHWRRLGRGLQRTG